MLGAGLPEIWSRKVPHRKNEWIGALLYLQGHIHKKFCIAVGGFRGAAVFFRDGCNRGKADAGSAVFGGTVSALAFPDVSVKAVGGDDIQSVSMADFRGEAEIPGLRADRPASGDGIFHEIPEQRRHVKLEKGKGLRQLNVPVGADFCLDCHLVIVAEQGVQRGVGTVIHRCVLCKAGVIFRKMRPDAAGVALFRKG